MLTFKNLGYNLLIGTLGLFVLLPAGYAANRDKTVDYYCRPKWDKYIVDEKTTQWDPDSMLCFDKDGNSVDPALVYGKPSMYGENTGGVADQSSNAQMYGDPSGILAKHLYGEPVNDSVKPKPAPVRTAAPVATSGKPKPVTKAKPVKPKPVVKPAVAVKVTEEKVKPVAVAPVEKKIDAPVPSEQPIIAKEKAVPKPRNPGVDVIASTLQTAIDIDSFCEQINPPVKGPLPAGLVLMPGRPDRMSCVQK